MENSRTMALTPEMYLAVQKAYTTRKYKYNVLLSKTNYHT